MEPTITPEPSPAERVAILEALRRQAGERPASAWWQAGTAEALADAASDPGTAPAWLDMNGSAAQ